MSSKVLHYLPSDIRALIVELIDQYTAGTVDLSPEELLTRIEELLPLEKMKRETTLRRIEGYSFATDKLWDKTLEIGHLDRKQILARAKLRPMSYYHYMTGSNVPADYASTRADLLNDPTTARVKLRDDIMKLAELLMELRSETAPA